jgi:hypothetical protein
MNLVPAIQGAIRERLTGPIRYMRDSDRRDEIEDLWFVALGMSDSDLPGITAWFPGEINVNIPRQVQSDFSVHPGGDS